MSINRLIKMSVLLVLIVFAVSLGGDIVKLMSFEKGLDETNQKIAELEEKKSELEARRRYLASESYQEIQIRNKLGMAKEGEIVVVLPGEDILRKLSPRKFETNNTELSLENWEKWFYVFLN